MIHILIADPDPAMSKALSLLLPRELSSTTTSEVRDVEGLIQTLIDTTPNVLLLDWKLYGSPAPETFRLLRKAFPALKIILLSADANDRCSAQAVGADFIYKDEQPDQLIATLRALLLQDYSLQNYPPDQGKTPPRVR